MVRGEPTRSSQRTGPGPTLPPAGAAPVLATGTGVVLLAVIGLALLPTREHLSPAVPALLFALVVAVGGALGGRVAVVVLAAAATFGLVAVFVRPAGAWTAGVIEAAVGFAAFSAAGGGSFGLYRWASQSEQEAGKAEEDLAELSRKVASLTIERSVLADEAERAEHLAARDAQRTALLRSVSHDLRTPLSAIRAVASDLREGVVYDDETRRQLLQTVCDEVDRLDQMVANLLSMSRVEAGTLEPDYQAIDLPELIVQRTAALGPVMRHVTVRTSFADDLPLVFADYSMVEEVLTNLLGNAARHAPVESDVWVVAEDVVDEGGSSFVKVEVSDRGDGIPEVDRDRIFEPFTRGAGSRSTGLGLAICKAMVEAHGGRIWVERTFGGGATFCFTLPIYGGEMGQHGGNGDVP